MKPLFRYVDVKIPFYRVPAIIFSWSSSSSSPPSSDDRENTFSILEGKMDLLLEI
jgi:hypothetical protein